MKKTTLILLIMIFMFQFCIGSEKVDRLYNDLINEGKGNVRLGILCILVSAGAYYTAQIYLDDNNPESKDMGSLVGVGIIGFSFTMFLCGLLSISSGLSKIERNKRIFRKSENDITINLTLNQNRQFGFALATYF